MKYSRIILGGLVAFTTTAHAMPTQEETKKVESSVMDLVRDGQTALKSGSKTRVEVAESVMELAEKAESEAEKLLLMKGAFNLYVRAGEFDKAIETLQSLQAAIPDIPPANIANIIETALPGDSKKGERVLLYKLLEKSKKVVAKSGAPKDGTHKRLEIAEGQKTYGGYTWSYRVKNGEATLVAEKDGKYSCAVSPTPTGVVSIPPTLNGVKVTSIGWDAFRNCKQLTSVTIPEGMTHIDGRAFDLCDGLTAVTLPSSLKVVGFAAFGKCAGLKSVVIPDGVTSIKMDAFNGCRGLKSVVIPNSVTSIGDRAFFGCRELTSVTIPAKVARIGEGAFGCCSRLKQINLVAGNQSFTLVEGVLYKKDMSVLLACPGTMTSVAIPSGVSKIGAFAFREYNGLNSVTISEGVTNIAWGAFRECSGLRSVTIPESVKVIGAEAFEDCVELVSVTMRGERPEAPNDIFKKCGKLKSIHVPENAKSWAGLKTWQGIPLVFGAK